MEGIGRQYPLSAYVKQTHWLRTYKWPADSIRQTDTDRHKTDRHANTQTDGRTGRAFDSLQKIV